MSAVKHTPRSSTKAVFTAKDVSYGQSESDVTDLLPMEDVGPNVSRWDLSDITKNQPKRDPYPYRHVSWNGNIVVCYDALSLKRARAIDTKRKYRMRISTITLGIVAASVFISWIS